VGSAEGAAAKIPVRTGACDGDCEGVAQQELTRDCDAQNARCRVPDDVDNTLLDNDGVQADLKGHLEQAYGSVARERYWQILEELRSELGYVDYLGALERFRVEEIHRPDVLRMSNWLVDYPFANRLYPGAW